LELLDEGIDDPQMAVKEVVVVGLGLSVVSHSYSQVLPGGDPGELSGLSG